MPPKRGWIDKKSAATYQLFHRSQNDPLIHDPEADDRVLHQVSGPSQVGPSTASKKSQDLSELEKEFHDIRKNEGEAANYGIFYDDSEYDYMQHLRDLGQGGGQFVEAMPAKGKGKVKPVKLEDALRQTSLNDHDDNASASGAGSVYNDDLASTASSYVRQPTYQDQQNIPDSIAGFQPDMDPRLREVLEALDDEAFVDPGDEEDVFESLVEGGHDAEMDDGDWRDTYIEDDDDGWESDATEKAPVQPNTTSAIPSETPNDDHQQTSSALPAEDEFIPDTNPHDGDWLRDFAKYKKDMKSKPSPAAHADNASAFRTATSTAFTEGGTPIRKKKRKGAMTNPSAYSMTSSSIARTEGLRLLDDRFEKVEALYSLDEEGEEDDEGIFDGSSMGGYDNDNMSVASGASKFSEAPSLVSASGAEAPLRSDFNSIMDGFLDGWDDRRVHAKRKGAKGKRGKNGNEVAGIRMLDEVRQGLGPAKLPGRA